MFLRIVTRVQYSDCLNKRIHIPLAANLAGRRRHVRSVQRQQWRRKECCRRRCCGNWSYAGKANGGEEGGAKEEEVAGHQGSPPVRYSRMTVSSVRRQQ